MTVLTRNVFGWVPNASTSTSSNQPFFKQIRCIAAKGINQKRSKFNPEIIGKRLRHQNVKYGSRRSNRPHAIIPPYWGIHEARVMLNLSYQDAFDYFGVHCVAKKYYWKDHEGRAFETVAKRKVYLPYEMCAARLASWDYIPIQVDMEPEWKTPIARGIAPVPCFVVLGHINHGKTTLLNAIRGRREDEMDEEPGG